jgi:hypothetical protein
MVAKVGAMVLGGVHRALVDMRVLEEEEVLQRTDLPEQQL